MRFGVSCGFDWLPALKDAGYDYIETSLVGLLEKSEEEIAEIDAEADARTNAPAFLPPDQLPKR